MEKKKSHKLSGDFAIPFSIFAISYPENIVKATWSINHALKLELQDSNNPILTTDSSNNSFLVFSDQQTNPEFIFSLIANKTNQSVLVKDLPNIDYLFEIIGKVDKETKEKIVKQLKNITGVIAVIELSADRIKRKSPFTIL